MHWQTSGADKLQRAILSHFGSAIIRNIETFLALTRHPGRIDELFLLLDCITFRGSISDYVRHFQRVEIQIPEDAMPFDDRKRIFLRKLPVNVAMWLDQHGQPGMESVYSAARLWESFAKARENAHLDQDYTTVLSTTSSSLLTAFLEPTDADTMTVSGNPSHPRPPVA
ncbi:hypothetical protein EI94DRAFT_1900014 [Lactarius quietus]|nr:hypothetical protein EI94DRAFT_1912776 [Lactarius quietus]KAF8259880.1 hypothetical protein EI94DRAFT_1900014 [Lactarius quietus]